MLHLRQKGYVIIARSLAPITGKKTTGKFVPVEVVGEPFVRQTFDGHLSIRQQIALREQRRVMAGDGFERRMEGVRVKYDEVGRSEDFSSSLLHFLCQPME